MIYLTLWLLGAGLILTALLGGVTPKMSDRRWALWKCPACASYTSSDTGISPDVDRRRRGRLTCAGGCLRAGEACRIKTSGRRRQGEHAYGRSKVTFGPRVVAIFPVTPAGTKKVKAAAERMNMLQRMRKIQALPHDTYTRIRRMPYLGEERDALWAAVTTANRLPSHEPEPVRLGREYAEACRPHWMPEEEEE